MGPAPIDDIVIDQGGTFERTFTHQDAAGTYRDFSTDSVTAAIYTEPGGTLVATLTTTVTTNPATGDANEGLKCSLTADDTEALTPGSYVWEIEIIPASGAADRWKVVRGRATIRREILP